MNQPTNQPDNGSIVALFRKLTLGVYVIGVTDGLTQDAFTASSVTQVSYQPLMMCLAINPKHAAYALLTAGRTWTVNILRDDQMELARRFGTTSKPGPNKMRGMTWGSGRMGAPFLISSLAYFDCELTANYPAGDHNIVVGQVIHGKLLATHATPLSYATTGDLDHTSALFPASFEAQRAMPRPL